MFNQRSKNGSFEETWGFLPLPPPKEDGIQFRLGESPEESGGVQSPPLWKNNNNSPELTSPSPAAASIRIQAIIKGQKELMDMVKKMPESNYELTLKDLVEQHQHQQEEEDQLILLNSSTTTSKDDKKIDMQQQGRRNWIINNKGLLINMMMVFHFPINGIMKSKSTSFPKNKKKNSDFLKSSSSSSAKISPKPADVCDDNNNQKSKNGGWLRRNMFSGGTDCTRSNIHNSSTIIKRTRGGFYLFNCMSSCFKLQNDSKAP